jgi:hypothetical protein
LRLFAAGGDRRAPASVGLTATLLDVGQLQPGELGTP